MHVRTHPQRTDLSRAVTLELSIGEAIALEAVLGGMRGNLARTLPWYDRIADALENDLLPSTISQAVEARFRWFTVAPTQYDADGNIVLMSESESLERPDAEAWTQI